AAYDEARAQASGADGFVRKPFEASVLLSMVQPLIEKPEMSAGSQPGTSPALPPPAPAAPRRPVDREQVRAAVILALDASMITMIENITDKVVVELESEARQKMTPDTAPVETEPASTAAATPTQPI